MNYEHWIIVLLNASAACKMIGNVLILIWGMVLLYSGILNLQASKKLNKARTDFQKRQHVYMDNYFADLRKSFSGKEPWQE